VKFLGGPRHRDKGLSSSGSSKIGAPLGGKGLLKRLATREGGKRKDAL